MPSESASSGWSPWAALLIPRTLCISTATCVRPEPMGSIHDDQGWTDGLSIRTASQRTVPYVRWFVCKGLGRAGGSELLETHDWDRPRDAADGSTLPTDYRSLLDHDVFALCCFIFARDKTHRSMFLASVVLPNVGTDRHRQEG